MWYWQILLEDLGDCIISSAMRKGKHCATTITDKPEERSAAAEMYLQGGPFGTVGFDL